MACARGVPLVVILLAGVPAWADGGWYLLVPPRSDYDQRAEYLSAYKILDNKPLSQWSQQGAYDSAAECEAVRSSLLNVEQRVYSKAADAYRQDLSGGADPVALRMQRFITETDNVNVSALLASRCIRSDDVRLRR
jgi:hypothetical protein